MSAVEASCRLCGNKLTLEDPPVTGIGARLARALAKNIICDSCADGIDAQEERERAAAARLERLAESGIPTPLQALTWDMWPTRPAVTAAKGWAENAEPRGLLLFGDVGVGKTWLAGTAAIAALSVRPVRWVSAAQLLIDLRSGYGADERERAQALLKSRGALILDDLDKVNPTDYGREVIYALVDGRVSENAPLIVTANVEPEEMARLYGDPVVSRLRGHCKTLKMSGEDRRLAG